jgi:hypothetical protein
VESAFGVLPFFLRLTAIFGIALILDSCSPAGSFCKEAYMIFAIAIAACFFFSVVALVFTDTACPHFLDPVKDHSE